jgi:hypothetical protein
MTLVDLVSPVQPISLIKRITNLLRAYPGDLPTIFECRLALALALHPQIAVLGVRHIRAYAGLGMGTTKEHLPQTGQTSRHGLIYCHDRGRSCRDEAGQTPGRYELCADIEVSDELTFADPAKDCWADHRVWALAMLYGPTETTVPVAELDAVLGSRKLSWLAFHRLQAEGLACKPRRGQVLLLLDHAAEDYDPFYGRMDRCHARLDEIAAEARRAWSRVRDKIRDRWRTVMQACIAGRMSLARYLGHELTEDDLLAYPDDLRPDNDAESWAQEQERRRRLVRKA